MKKRILTISLILTTLLCGCGNMEQYNAAKSDAKNTENQYADTCIVALPEEYGQDITVDNIHCDVQAIYNNVWPTIDGYKSSNVLNGTVIKDGNTYNFAYLIDTEDVWSDYYKNDIITEVTDYVFHYIDIQSASMVTGTYFYGDNLIASNAKSLDTLTDDQRRYYDYVIFTYSDVSNIPEDVLKELQKIPLGYGQIDIVQLTGEVPKNAYEVTTWNLGYVRTPKTYSNETNDYENALVENNIKTIFCVQENHITVHTDDGKDYRMEEI